MTRKQITERQRRGRADVAAEGEIDLPAIMGCTCLRLRRTTRRVTQLYDQVLAPAGMTVNQFGLLARLYGASLRGATLSIGALADQHGMDPTTLNRNLKPLLAAGLVDDRHDAADRRVRTVSLTEAGRRRLARAMPLWRTAQQRVEAALGAEATLALNGLLDLSVTKLAA